MVVKSDHYVQQRYLAHGLSIHRHFSTKLILITMWSSMTNWMRTRNHYCKKHQRTHDPVDWEMFKSLSKQVNHQLKRAKADHYTAICKDMSRNAKPTWDHLNSALGRTSRKPMNSISCNNKTLTQAADIVNAFAKHFGSVQSPDLPNCKTRITHLSQQFSNFQ